jgi:hypothetical protein
MKEGKSIRRVPVLEWGSKLWLQSAISASLNGQQNPALGICALDLRPILKLFSACSLPFVANAHPCMDPRRDNSDGSTRPKKLVKQGGHYCNLWANCYAQTLLAFCLFDFLAA